MFRLFCAASLAGGLWLCGSAVRGAALCDWHAAVEVRACPACGGAVVFDPATGRASACGGCREGGPHLPAGIGLAAR